MTRIPVDPTSATIKIKRSKFISYLEPLRNTEDAANTIKRLGRKYPESNHICWAYRVNDNGNIVEYYSDAGEPTGTAGLPILNSLLKADLINAILAVVRIFGGIKLGKVGLKAAYSDASLEVINAANFSDWIPMNSYLLTCSFDYVGDLSSILKRLRIKPQPIHSSAEIIWRINLPNDAAVGNIDEIKAAMRGKLSVSKE
jgi:uncharacterized YigZ family protein